MNSELMFSKRGVAIIVFMSISLFNQKTVKRKKSGQVFRGGGGVGWTCCKIGGAGRGRIY
jgi:hypothetical protein